MSILPTGLAENWEIVEAIFNELKLSILSRVDESDMLHLSDSTTIFRDKLKLYGLLNDISYKWETSPSLYRFLRQSTQYRGSKAALNSLIQAGYELGINSSENISEVSRVYFPHEITQMHVDDGFVVVITDGSLRPDMSVLNRYIPAGYRVLFMSEFLTKDTGILKYWTIKEGLDKLNLFLFIDTKIGEDWFGEENLTILFSTVTFLMFQYLRMHVENSQPISSPSDTLSGLLSTPQSFSSLMQLEKEESHYNDPEVLQYGDRISNLADFKTASLFINSFNYEEPSPALFFAMNTATGDEEDLITPPICDISILSSTLPSDTRELIHLYPDRGMFDILDLSESSQQINECYIVDSQIPLYIMSLVVEDTPNYDYGFMSQSEGQYIPSDNMGDIRARFTQSLSEVEVIFGEMSTQDIIVGETTEVPLGTVGFKSKYYWVYQFNTGSISNPWQGQYYPEVPTSYSFNGTVPNADIVNAYIGGKDTNDVVQPVIDVSAYPTMTYYIGQYISGGVPLPEFYTTNAPATDIVIGKMGTLVEFTSNYTGVSNTEWDLPSDLYTINGTTVTWNTLHIMYSLFYGKPVIAI